MKKTNIDLSFKLWPRCPHCGEKMDWDNYDYECDLPVTDNVFNNKWKDMNIQVKCPFCEKDFIIEDVEY
jgi:endogenous inhibitor of DNA gyrase (YacG/DUF329 family)